MTTISMLMPCLNPGPYLADCLAAVVPQLRPDDELIVQDACSTDGAAAELDRAAATDPRIQVVHERDRGQSDGLNRALARARGDLVGWVNADDVLLPGALELMRGAVRGGELVVGGWQVLAAEGGVLRTYPARELLRRPLLLRGCYAFSGGMLVGADLLRRIGGYSEDLHYAMDFDLMLRLAGAVRSQELADAPVAALRLHPGSKSGSAAGGFAKDGFTVRRRHSRGPAELAVALAGTGLQLAAIATHQVRFRSEYTWVRSLVRR